MIQTVAHTRRRALKIGSVLILPALLGGSVPKGDEECWCVPKMEWDCITDFGTGIWQTFPDSCDPSSIGCTY